MFTANNTSHCLPQVLQLSPWVQSIEVQSSSSQLANQLKSKTSD